MTVHHAVDYLNEFADAAIEELDALIARRFASHRTIRAVEQPDGRWIAMTGENRMLFPPADRAVVERFVAAFVRHEPRFVAAAPELGFSERVADNVVPIGGRVEA
jgi:hypothetical protein